VFVDGILLNGLTFPVIFATGLPEKMRSGQLSLLEILAVMMLSTLSWLLLQGYMLAARGQTIGKWLLKIQIVDESSNCLLPIFRVILLRYFWTVPILLVYVFLPLEVAIFIFNLATIGNVLWILGDDKRCLHDYVAGSKVVGFVPTRTSLWGGIRESDKQLDSYDELAGNNWELKLLRKRVFYLEQLADPEKRDSALELISATGAPPKEYLRKTVQLVSTLKQKVNDDAIEKKAESLAERIRSIESDVESCE
jgi:uncharacterized RDD family membrane protein YckC